MKATKGRSDVLAQEEARGHNFISAWYLMIRILRLVSGGFEQFAEQTAKRILADHADEVILNYCPRCHELARTPKAQQCRFCGFDWHRVSTITMS
jgi:hypothetical protein